MADKEPPIPAGCWQLLLGLPVILAASWFAGSWEAFIGLLLAPYLSPEAVDTAAGFSLIAIMLGTWIGVMELFDRVFGTTLSSHTRFDYAPPHPATGRMRRRALLIVIAVVLIDQITKTAFGVVRSQSVLGHPADSMAVFHGFGLALFFVAWWRSRTSLQVVGLSLVLGGLVGLVSDYTLRGGPVGFTLPYLPPLMNVAGLASAIGFVMFVTGWFREPRRKGSATPPPER